MTELPSRRVGCKPACMGVQVYTAEEKAALAMVNFEENKRKVGVVCFHISRCNKVECSIAYSLACNEENLIASLQLSPTSQL